MEVGQGSVAREGGWREEMEREANATLTEHKHFKKQTKDASFSGTQIKTRRKTTTQLFSLQFIETSNEYHIKFKSSCYISRVR